MVGREPDLNPVHKKSNILKYLKEFKLDLNDVMSASSVKPCLVDDASMSRSLVRPRDIQDDDDDTSLLRPSVKPCYSRHDVANLFLPVIQPCNTRDDAASSSSRRLLKPCHLRGVEDNDYDDDDDTSLLRPSVKPRYSRDDVANLSIPVIRACNTRDDAASSSSRRLLKPYHLRGVEENDYRGTLATPLIQVFSVSISPYIDDGKPCEINGSIRFLEESGRHFDLYNRNPKDSETIWKDGTLSLIVPNGTFLVPSLSTVLELRLFDRLRDIELVVENLSFDFDSTYRLKEVKVKGAHGVAFVNYAIFPFAVNGTVLVTFTEYNDDNGVKNCDAANIYGSIITEYEDARAYCTADKDLNKLETRLLHKPADEPLRVVIETPIPLSRNVVAVPAYSSITIKLSLWDSNGKIADESLQYPAYLLGENPQYIRTKYACVEVRVRWDDACFYLYKNQTSSWSEPKSIMKSGKESSGTPHVQPPIFPRRENPFYYVTLKVDVLSVLVGGIGGKITALCGAIIVNDGSDYFTIYNRDDNSAELLSDDSVASVDVNYRSISNHAFGLILHLWDPVGKLEVSRGSFGWNESNITHLVQGYNRRFCSVVRGDAGYAAVHYQMFSYAFEARVEVKLICDFKPEIPINLHGTLFGRCSGDDYSTSYQKKYYMSRLFDRSDRSVEMKPMKPGSKIPLLKSIIIVPSNSSLIIEAKLSTFGIEDGVAETICGMAEFEIDKCNTIVKSIRGERYGIEISVKFKYS